MKIIKIFGVLILMIFGFYTFFVIVVESISGDKRSNSFSYSLDESIRESSLVAIYEIDFMEDSTKQWFEKFGFLSILDTSKFWLEKSTGYKSEFLYLNRKVFSKENYLVFKNPRESLEQIDSSISMKIRRGEFPDFGVSRYKNFQLTNINNENEPQIKIRFGGTLEKRLSTSGNCHNFAQKISTIEIGDSIPEKIIIWTYLPFENFKKDDIDCGRIALKLDTIINSNNFKDVRRIWERVTYVPLH